MSKPFCSTGEPWDKEADFDNVNEIWEVFRDNENGDVILWVYGSDNTSLELRMSRAGTLKLASTLIDGAINNERSTNHIKRTLVLHALNNGVY